MVVAEIVIQLTSMTEFGFLKIAVECVRRLPIEEIVRVFVRYEQRLRLKSRGATESWHNPCQQDEGGELSNGFHRG